MKYIWLPACSLNPLKQPSWSSHAVNLLHCVFQVRFLFGENYCVCLCLCLCARLPTVYIRFKTEPENTTVYQGHTAILHCQATGDPEPHIHWTVKDKPLELSKNRR